MHLQNIPNTLDQDGKLNPQFVEYMMGLPEGWVTDAGLSRTQQLKMLGNGVVPQQALFALSQIMR
jgi:DNA (cytosine-5)-methyltransferase 1